MCLRDFAREGVYIRQRSMSDGYLAGDMLNELASAISCGSV
jgi:hypothetical protein